MFGPTLLERLKEIVATGIARSGDPELASRDAIGDLSSWIGMGLLETVGPVAVAAALAAFVANVAQVRLKLAFKAAEPSLRPFNLVQGTWEDIKAPEAVAVDKTYFNELGIKGIGDTAQIANGRVRVRAITDGVRSFTQSPYTYTTLNRARALFGDSDGTTFYLVQLQPGANVEKVRDDLQSRLEGAEVLTQAEFRDRSLKQWLFRTGAGVALIGGALLGSLVGTVIVAQTLYSSTKDHLGEFATLRALGSSSGYIHQVILAQAGISAVVGYALGISIALTILVLSRNTALPMVMTPGLAFWLFTLTVGMCAISALSAIVKVTKIDPATVFNR